MTPEDKWICSLIDGDLTQDERAGLADSLQQQPDLLIRLQDELVISDMMSRVQDPSRSKETFLSRLDEALDTAAESNSVEIDNIIELPNIYDDQDDVFKDIHKMPEQQERKRSTAINLFWKMAAGFVICAGLFWQFALGPGGFSGTIARIDDAGQGFEVHRGKTVIAPAKDTPLKSGDLIVSSKPNQRLAFNFSDGSKVALFNGGSIRVEEYRRKGKRLSLESGKVAFEVTPQDTPFRVTTQHGTVKVVGTAFSVATSDSAMTLNVTEGVVETENVMKQKIAVRAGEMIVASKDNARMKRFITLPATADSTIVNFRYADENYGHETSVGTSHQNRGPIADFLLTFDLSSIPEDIIHASVRLYCAKTEGYVHPIAVHRTTHASWKEGTINWKTAKEQKTDITGPTLATWMPKSPEYNTIDLDDTTLSELADSTNLSLRFTTASPGWSGATFASREHPDIDKRPMLILELGDPDVE